MALARKSGQLRGWDSQAERLTLKHTAVAKMAFAASEQTRPRQSLDQAPCHPSLHGTKFPYERRTRGVVILDDAATAEQQARRDSAATWITNSRREILAVRAANDRISELEVELGIARERAASLDSENESLRTALALIADETSEVNHVCEQLRSIVQAKESLFQKLEMDYVALLSDTDKLLKTNRVRDDALARAEERIGSLTELFVQLEEKMTAVIERSSVGERHSDTAVARGRAINSDDRLRFAKPRQNEPAIDDWLLAPHKGS